MIAHLQCVSCNAPLAITDAASVSCLFCGTTNTIPDRHREALRLARDLDEATRDAIREWSHLNHLTLPRWLFVSTAILPFVLMAGGLGLTVVLAFLQPETRIALPYWLGLVVWLR